MVIYFILTLSLVSLSRPFIFYAYDRFTTSRQTLYNLLVKPLSLSQYITKTCLYNTDPLKPHFYIVKLGFTGVYIVFLISVQNIDCGYSLVQCGYNLCFEQKYEKYQRFLSENYQFLEVKFSIYLNRRVFVMTTQMTHKSRRVVKPHNNQRSLSQLQDVAHTRKKVQIK